MLGEIVESDGHGVRHQQSENSPTRRQVANLLRGPGVDAHVHELTDAVIWTDDSQSAVGGVHKIGGGLHDAAQGRAQFKTGRDRDDGGKESVFAIPPGSVLALWLIVVCHVASLGGGNRPSDRKFMK